MSILKVFKKSAQSADTSDQAFRRTYTSLPRFNKTKRLHITVNGDREAEKNCAKLLGNEHLCDSVGEDITLTGFNFDGGSGIRVSVNSYHVGVVWGNDEDYVFKAAWSDDIEGVFVRIELGLDDRPEAKLFVKLAE